MSNIYFISDTHFNHKNIILYSKRPYSSVEDMNESLINNWNNLVKPGDVVYHLGDFAFMPYNDFKKLVRRLNGNKHVILGNHDSVIEDNMKDLLSSNIFANIKNYHKLKINNQKIILFHYACRVWDGSHYGSIMLYGHSHGNLLPYGKSVDVGVDCKEITTEYRPIHLDEILQYMSSKNVEKPDHHDER